MLHPAPVHRLFQEQIALERVERNTFANEPREITTWKFVVRSHPENRCQGQQAVAECVKDKQIK